MTELGTQLNTMTDRGQRLDDTSQDVLLASYLFYSQSKYWTSRVYSASPQLSKTHSVNSDSQTKEPVREQDKDSKGW